MGPHMLESRAMFTSCRSKNRSTHFVVVVVVVVVESLKTTAPRLLCIVLGYERERSLFVCSVSCVIVIALRAAIGVGCIAQHKVTMMRYCDHDGGCSRATLCRFTNVQQRGCDALWRDDDDAAAAWDRYKWTRIYGIGGIMGFVCTYVGSVLALRCTWLQYTVMYFSIFGLFELSLCVCVDLCTLAKIHHMQFHARFTGFSHPNSPTVSLSPSFYTLIGFELCVQNWWSIHWEPHNAQHIILVTISSQSGGYFRFLLFNSVAVSHSLNLRQ